MRGLLLATFLCVANCATAVEVDVGGETLVIPTPVGFVEGGSLSAKALALAEQLTPPMNRLLAFFVSADDAGRLKKGEAATWRRYMMVQAERQSEGLRIAPDDFFELRGVLTAQQKTLQATVLKKAETVIENLSNNIDTELKIGESVSLGIFSEDQAHISIAGLARYQTSNQKPAVSYVVANAANVLHPANKIVFAYVYSGFDSRDDLDWVEATSVSWSRSILAANAKSTSGGVIDWARAGSKAIWGGIVGAVMTIAFLLFRQWRRKTA